MCVKLKMNSQIMTNVKIEDQHIKVYPIIEHIYLHDNTLEIQEVGFSNNSI